ncbi:MAG TPA: ABC transporter substrate-binding protein [Chloroflexota bacterium]|nr:ABC transporter substrate-binding protein [Chloroflexota bacterium]
MARASDVQTLTTVIGSYPHTAALKEGGVRPSGLALSFVEVSPIIAAFRRMVRGLEFDVCEMALSTYLVARERGKPFTAIPVFPVRGFHHDALAYHVKAGIQRPKDLEGKRVGVRAYTVTTGVWARGILAREHGVDLDRVTWVVFDEEHVQEYRPPRNVEAAPAGAQMATLLAEGALDAAIGAGAVDSPDVRPLIPDAAGAAAAWSARTGVYPINHTVVVRDTLLEREPGIARALYEAFVGSKEQFLARLRAGEAPGREAEALASRRAIVGDDPLPYGLPPNRAAVQMLAELAHDQHLISRLMEPEALFAQVE